MAELTNECLLKHRQLIMCRRAALGEKIDMQLSQGVDVSCLETKMKIIDGLSNVICNFDPDLNNDNPKSESFGDFNCLIESEVCSIIEYLYILLPEEC